MLTVIETPMFMRYAAKVWDDAERDEFIAWLAEHPDAGDVIAATGGLRKVRTETPSNFANADCDTPNFIRASVAAVTATLVTRPSPRLAWRIDSSKSFSNSVIPGSLATCGLAMCHSS